MSEEEQRVVQKVAQNYSELSIRLSAAGVPSELLLTGVLHFISHTIPKEIIDDAYRVYGDSVARMSDS